MNQVFLIDKPAGWTSFDVVAKVRNALGNQRPETRNQDGNKANSQKRTANNSRLRVGHAGTLDPFATGLLIVLVGDETKNQDKYMKLDKEYEATLKLGYTSTTGDPEGTIVQITNEKLQIPNKLQISNVLKKFIGKIEQIPPKYSAIKVNGKRAYKLAREGKEFELKPRKVMIYELRVTSYPPSPKGYGRASKYPELKIKVKCSSGTYMRTLAEDIGKALGPGAYLTTLRRTKIGKYDVKDAKKIEDLV